VRALRPQGRGPEAGGLGVVSGPARARGRTGRDCPLEALVVLAQLVVTGTDSRRLTREAPRATAMTLDADLCELLRVSPDGQRFVRVASSDEEAASHEPDGVVGGVSSAAGYALLCGAPVVSGDLRHERRFRDTGGAAVGRSRLRGGRSRPGAQRYVRCPGRLRRAGWRVRRPPGPLRRPDGLPARRRPGTPGRVRGAAPQGGGGRATPCRTDGAPRRFARR
jgi:hypothetical protein